ncbi:hypothetical protein BJV74DRAFT_952235 [Russula compacta]|nr:hypothetical protein BJV74DRAFT_952235 [Russula compacta]
MQRTSMKWGKAAKLAAGAAVVFAMREQGQGDHTHHLAYLLSEPVVALKRTQLHLLSHLHLTLPRTHPCVHLPTLTQHLSDLASATPTSLPKDTFTIIRPLVLSPIVLQDVLRTARALRDLSSPERSILNRVSAGATACALLLLALKARARPPRSAPHVLVLATQIGAALGAHGAAVMACYRILADVMEAGATRVPWLANASAARGNRLSQRSGVAKVILDVLQFRNEHKRAEIAKCGGPVSVNVEEEEDGGIEAGDKDEDEVALDALIAKAYMREGSTAGRVRKYKKPRTTMSQAACLLLNPLAPMALAHTTYLLSSDTAAESAMLPTWLQLLAVERGNAEAIHDNELFSDGELEGIVIGTDEQAGDEPGRRAQALRMMWGEEVSEARADQKGRKKKGKGRVDMNKLAALLDSDDPFATLGIEESSPSEEGGLDDDGESIGSRCGKEVESE